MSAARKAAAPKPRLSGSPPEGEAAAPGPAEEPTPLGDTRRPVDFECLSRAIQRSVAHRGMRDEEARAIAAHVLNFFGFNERIIDNVLEPDDRYTFYMLEERGILGTERDETTLYDGREWRIHYWMFRKERIFALAAPDPREGNGGRRDGASPGDEGGTAVYHELEETLWIERMRSATDGPSVGETVRGAAPSDA